MNLARVPMNLQSSERRRFLTCGSFRWSQSNTPSRAATVRERFPRSHALFHPAAPEAALTPDFRLLTSES